MKKEIIVILSSFSLLLTFIFSQIFSIYHFGSVPTLLTLLYLILIFVLFEYLALSITYICRKRIKHEKIDNKKIIGLILLLVALLLLILFLIVMDVDYLHRYMYSSPFYLNVIVRSVEFLLPSIVLIAISIILLKKKK